MWTLAGSGTSANFRLRTSERANEQKYERISEWMQWVTKVKILGKVKWKWARISVAETPISTLETPISFWKAYLNWFIQTLIRTKRACFGFILYILNRVLLFLHRNTLFTRELLGVDKPINKAKLIFVYFFSLCFRSEWFKFRRWEKLC